MALKETSFSNESDSFDRHEIVNDSLHAHEEIPDEEVCKRRSEKDQGPVQYKYLENKYSRSLDDIEKVDVYTQKQTKPKTTKETFPVKPREAAVVVHERGKQVVTPLKVRLETLSNSSDEHMVLRNESHNTAREKEDFSRAGIFS